MRRYVAGDGLDQARLWFEGAGLGDARYLHADEQGSVIAASTSAGAASLYAYGVYGNSANDNCSGVRRERVTHIPSPKRCRSKGLRVLVRAMEAEGLLRGNRSAIALAMKGLSSARAG